MFPRWAIAVVLLAGCKKEGEKPKQEAVSTTPAPDCAAPTEKTGAIAWYEDDLAAGG
jgi:hypothetical protein